jgi:hypothetical protein
MSHSGIVLRGVFVLRRVATSDMAADQAQPQMDPIAAGLYAVLADLFFRRGNFYLIQMPTFNSHGAPTRSSARWRSRRHCYNALCRAILG